MKNINLPFKCADCQTVTYPDQGFCHSCLSENGAAMTLPIAGKILATSLLHHSLEEDVQAHLPLMLTSVEIDGGVAVFAIASHDIVAEDTVILQEKNMGFGTLLTASKE